MKQLWRNLIFRCFPWNWFWFFGNLSPQAYFEPYGKVVRCTIGMAQKKNKRKAGTWTTHVASCQLTQPLPHSGLWVRGLWISHRSHQSHSWNEQEGAGFHLSVPYMFYTCSVCQKYSIVGIVLAKRQYFMWETHQEDSLILQSESSKWLRGIYRNACSDRSRSSMARHLKCDCGRRSRKKKSGSIFKIRSFAHLV